MAATLTQERFTGPDWIFERKLDGIRLLAYRDAAGVRLYSRTRREHSHAPVSEAIAQLPVTDIILDGEATAGWERLPDDYHVFDILWLNGRDLTQLPWWARRELLEQLPFRSPIENFYMTDPISRASETMAECTALFVLGQDRTGTNG